MSHAAGLPDPVLDARFYAGTCPRRLVAFAVDAVAIAALTALATLALALPTLGLALAFAGPIWLTTGFLYRWLSVARWSATPGMRLAGVELLDARGARLGETAAAAHAFAFLAACAFVVPQAISVAMMAFSRDGRGLHDRATGVALINSPA